MAGKRVAVEVSADSKHVFWLKAEGDRVKQGMTVASIEAGKGTSFVASPADGVLDEIVVGSGQMTRAGQPIAYILADE